MIRVGSRTVSHPGLTFANLLAFRDAVARAAGPEPHMMYVTRSGWAAIGGRPEDFDALPTVHFDKEPANG